METKVLALDIYGTVLSSTDYDNMLKPRKGLSELVKICNERQIPIVSTSDSDLTMLRLDLKEPLKMVGLDEDIFDRFYHLPTTPKDFSHILAEYCISPSELLVVGDTLEKDIVGAKELGCKTLLVPEYRGYGDKFDFSKINL